MEDINRTTALRRQLINSAIHAAIRRGARFVVSGQGRIAVRKADRIDSQTWNVLTANREEARKIILDIDREIESAKPQLCAKCGHELARWHNGGLYVSGHHFGWGEGGWAWMGHAIVDFTCRQCGARWEPDYPPATWRMLPQQKRM